MPKIRAQQSGMCIPCLIVALAFTGVVFYANYLFY